MDSRMPLFSTLKCIPRRGFCGRPHMDGGCLRSNSILRFRSILNSTSATRIWSSAAPRPRTSCLIRNSKLARVLQRQSGRKTVIGGSTYEIQILAPYHREKTGDSVAQERRGHNTHVEDNIE